ncbi:putative Cytochrome P450 [Seiridium cardinale]
MAPSISILPNIGDRFCSAFICLAILVVVFAAYHTFFVIHYPSNLPLAGEPAGRRWFSLRTRWRYLTDCASLYREAYEKFAKHGKTVLVPGFGARHEIILPQSAMRWVFSQPDSALSLDHAFTEIDQIHYGLGNEMYILDPWQGNLVKTEMNAVLENICAAMNDELGTAFDTYFGVDTENWKEIDLISTVRMIVAQAASRFTVGLPLCRNEEYLRVSHKINDALVLNAGLTGSCPKVLRPIIGPIFHWKIGGYVSQIKKNFEPVFYQRLHKLKSQTGVGNHDEPQDHLQLMLRYAQKHRPTELEDVEIMTRRLVVANFGSLHQTSIQVTNMLLEILGSDAEFNTISVLRDEVQRVIGDGNAEWTKAKVAQMHKADSVARETLRLNSFGNRATFRKVMVDGIVTEDGIKLPKGAMLSFLGYPAQVDGENLEDPFKYDPFRFSRAREAAADANGKPGLNNLSFVSTSPQHLPFGHGKHACPGRFLIDFELKMIIAYVLRNYDVEFPPEYNGKRPPNVWLAESNNPPPGVKVRVKRQMNSAP